MSVVPTISVQRFARVFSGYEQAHGRYNLKGKKESGKMAGKGRTMAVPITDAIWREHLEGTADGAGIIPLRSDDTVYFAAIDVDVYNLDVPGLAKRAQKYGLVTCRSKSGGAHLYMFFAEPQPAEDVIALMHDLAARLGHGGVEIFPKQTTRSSGRDTGNWINIPYFDAENGLRYAVDAETGDALSLVEFLDYADMHMQDGVPAILSPWEAPPEEEAPEEPEDQEGNKRRAPRSNPGPGLFDDGPPCLQHIAATGGFPDGTRNAGLFNVGVYLRKKHPDDWADRLMHYNTQMCHPPGGLKDIQDQVKALGKKEYSFLCKQPPIAQHCNRRACSKRAFGIGNTASSGVEIIGITKYPSEPVLWCVEVEGARIEMDTDTLFTHNKFARKVLEAINRVPAPMNGDRWSRYLNEKLQDCDEVAPPEDAASSTQFALYVETWLTGRTQARTRDELLLNKPYREGGRIYFLSNALRARMDSDGFRYSSMHQVWTDLKKMGAEQHDLTKVGGKPRRPWSLPDPDHGAEGGGLGPEAEVEHEEF